MRLSVGFLLLTVVGVFLGAAAAGLGSETSEEALPFCIVSGVCLFAAVISFWLAHRNGEDKISVHDYLTSLEEDSKL